MSMVWTKIVVALVVCLIFAYCGLVDASKGYKKEEEIKKQEER